VFARGVQAVLEDDPGHVGCRTIPDPHLAGDTPGLATEVGVVVPQSWEEMHRWRPALQREFARRRWLLLAQPRIAGLFTWLLDSRCCTILDPPALVLTRGYAPSPPPLRVRATSNPGGAASRSGAPSP